MKGLELVRYGLKALGSLASALVALAEFRRPAWVGGEL